MWKIIEPTEYFINLFSQTSINVFVTDFLNIWFASYTEEQFLEVLKEANVILEMADKEFIQRGKEMLTIPYNYHSTNVTKHDSKLCISLVKRLPFKFKLELDLQQGSDKLFFQKVTQVLLQTVDDLKTSQNKLRTLLIKKDKEIDEYKCEGGEIALRHLKTTPFNEVEHLREHKTYEENFGEAGIAGFLLKKTVEPEPRIEVKIEPNSLAVDIKEEPCLQNSAVHKPNLQTIEIKTEQPPSQNSVVIEQSPVKREVKSEVNVYTSPKKKMKRLNL